MGITEAREATGGSYRGDFYFTLRIFFLYELYTASSENLMAKIMLFITPTGKVQFVLFRARLIKYDAYN